MSQKTGQDLELDGRQFYGLSIYDHLAARHVYGQIIVNLNHGAGEKRLAVSTQRRSHPAASSIMLNGFVR